MFTNYEHLYGVNVYTASGEAIPILGRGTVGAILNCFHIPQVEKDLLSVSHIDAELGWRVTFGEGTGVVTYRKGKELFRGFLDHPTKLYLVNADAIIGPACDEDDLVDSEALVVALAAMTIGEYVNRFHDTFHAGSRRLEAMVKSGVVALPFDPPKIKPVGFQNVLLPFNACGLGKATRATFMGEVMTDVAVGSLQQTDISGKWATPSLQANV